MSCIVRGRDPFLYRQRRTLSCIIRGRDPFLYRQREGPFLVSSEGGPLLYCQRGSTYRAPFMLSYSYYCVWLECYCPKSN